MRIRSVTTVVLIALSAFGLVNGLRVVRSWANTPVAPTPRAIATVPAASAPADLSAYLALTRFHLETATASRDDASFKFLAFFLMATRATAQHCAARGVDVAAAVESFSSHHAAAYDQASDALAGNGLNAARIWQVVHGDIEKLALRHVGGLEPAGSDDLTRCRRLAANPEAYGAAPQRHLQLYRLEAR
ncbi:MAG: hypothetical protein ACOYLQ_03355 [Hyphomicrobiaceae bacterium]